MVKGDLANLQPTEGFLNGSITATKDSPNIISIPVTSDAGGDFIITLPHVRGLVSSIHINWDDTTPPAGNTVDITITNVNTGRAATTANTADGVVFIPESTAGANDFWVNGPLKLTLDDLGDSKKLVANITVIDH